VPRSAFILQGVVHDLSHLEPFLCTYVVPEQPGKAAMTYFVNVEFTMHCFTKTQQTGDDPERFYCNDRDGSPRLFDLERWALSLELPEIIRTLISRRITFTKRENLVTIELVRPNGELANYEVYFKVFKAGRRLFLEVESAYVRSPGLSNTPAIGRKIGFAVILKKVVAGEPLYKLR
jgi:hypothetical protein